MIARKENAKKRPFKGVSFDVLALGQKSMLTLNSLLETKSPSLKYRVMTELLDMSTNDQELIKIKSEIHNSEQVIQILSKMHEDGYWLQQNPRTKKYIGAGVEYGNYSTTHFCLSYLSELALTRDNPSIAKAAERYLNLQKEDGDWFQHLSCLFGYNIRTFIKLGYREDPRVQQSINLMLENKRLDHGYLCDLHEKKSKNKKSCIHGTTKVLMAFSELPEYWQHPRCKSLIGYFLNREGIYKSNDKESFIRQGIDLNAFPIIWQANLWEILYSLSKMGYGKDTRLKRAWDLLESKTDKDGRIKLDWAPPKSSWKTGKLKEYNEWLTFYILLAKKYNGDKL
jgi:hypothetical protein